MTKLNPDALAEWDDETSAPNADVRPNVQRDVTPQMIAAYVVAENELPAVSAGPFSEYLYDTWNDYVEDSDITQRDLISGALAFWRCR